MAFQKRLATTQWGFDGDRMQQELAAHLQALGATTDTSTWLGNPGVLRQVGRVLAERLDNAVDRIVVPSTAAHHAIGATLAGATGLRWTAFDIQDGHFAVGELHSGERLALVGLQPEDLAALKVAAGVEGQHLSVFAPAGDDRADALFHFDDAGRITPRCEAAFTGTLPSFFDASRGEPTSAADNPREIERLGTQMAMHLESVDLDAVLVWRGDRHAALAQAVAARRGVRVLRADEDLGLLSLVGEYASGDRVAIITAPWAPEEPIAPLFGLAINSALLVAAVVSLTVTDGPHGPARDVVVDSMIEVDAENPDAPGA